MIKMSKYQLWGRIGMTINVDDNNKAEFLNNPKEFILNGLMSGVVELDGETYFPELTSDNDEFQHSFGANDELTFDF